MLKKFCERFKELRTEMGYSQAKLATMVKTNQQAIDRWERGINEPDMATILQIAAIFDITTDYLLGATNNMYNNEHNETVATINGNIYGSNNNIVGNNRINIKK